MLYSSFSTITLDSIILVLFFLMIRRPPRSTPFPTRRSSDLPELAARLGRNARELVLERFTWRACAERSEEHTSELQSRENLVCRLLLEKKKKKKKKYYVKKKNKNKQ